MVLNAKPEAATKCQGNGPISVVGFQEGLKGAESKLLTRGLGQYCSFRVCGLVLPETLISPHQDEFRNQEKAFRNLMVI